jgi:ABC-type transport system involved in cytochrome bd biosynthesis fused ATPase/permease subunit
LQKGQIIERGRHAELLANQGLYARLCEAQGTHETIEQVFTHLEEASSM